MSDSRKAIGRVVIEIGSGYGIGGSNTLIPRNLCLLIDCVVSQQKVLGGDCVTSALALLDEFT